MLEEYEEWLSQPHESWEIANKLKLFEEATFEGLEAIVKEKWDLKRKKKLKERLNKLREQKEAFEKLKWQTVKIQEKKK